MIFFIAIVFIAQLVLLINIVIWSLSMTKKAQKLSKKLENENIKLERRIVAISKLTSDFNEVLPIIIKKIEKKRTNIIVRALIEASQGAVLLFFKPKYKKFLLGIKVLIRVMKDLSKSENML